ncbi:MAG: NAD(P)(+) transhydrogenase (Re/Si-specific) subunit beta [Nitrospinae bacterium]|nr:NAD(P)(+) transhydrogenase (Re/Si-specific) subunit beta [Nitrospinota bacterium]
MISTDLFAFVYLVAGVLFIFGLKGLSHPESARRGNTMAMVGMALAVGITLMAPSVKSYGLILIAMGLGAVIGIIIAQKIDMKAMPQLVAAFHSLVGLAAVLVAIGTYLTHKEAGALDAVLMTELALGSFIGAVTFTGSIVAFGKLQEIFGSAPVTFKGQHMLNLAFGIAIVALGVVFVMTDNFEAFLLLTILSLIVGVTLIIPIGGADMPVVVSMLNSYSGWAAAATGFTLNNILLIITGALVGSSGAILSYIMCKAMNRSFISVILGGFGAEAGSEEDTAMADARKKGVKEAAVEDAAFMMANASKVIIIPGYGMAVAQAQHAVKEMTEVMQAKGVEVKFAIHPVAGRMPGHMNVLLAEADVPYDIVFEMDEINNEFTTADVALIIGANDVVNPDAKTLKSSPLYGMPIIEAYKARLVFICKRSMKPGYAGVENSLFFADNASLVFGDAKATCEKLAAALHDA